MLVAVLAVAILGMTMISADSEAVALKDMPTGAEAIQDQPIEMVSPTPVDEPKTNYPVHEAPESNVGPAPEQSVTGPMQEPSPLIEKEPMMPEPEQEMKDQKEPHLSEKDDDVRGPEPFGPRNIPQMTDVPMERNEPADTEPLSGKVSDQRIVKISENSTTEEIIEEYEKVFYENKSPEKKRTIEIIDDNTYSEEVKNIVSAMREVIESDDQNVTSEVDFLILVIDKLESKGDSVAADIVKTILDQRFFGVQVQAEVQQPSPRSKEDLIDEIEDDIITDPVSIEDDEVEEDVPAFLDISDMVEGEFSFVPADMNVDVRYDNRGQSVAI